MRHRTVVLVIFLGVILCVGRLDASGLSKKYKNWDKSPDAYFLTSEEREQWKQVATDQEAEKFIAGYFERRGPDFRKMLDQRIAVADKYFSDGGAKGSETLRGKVIIVFGPPSGIDQSRGSDSLGVDVNPNNAVGGGAGGPGDPVSNVGSGTAGFAFAGKVKSPTFSIHYDKEHAPKPIGKAFRVDLTMVSAREQTPVDTSDLDQKFEIIARASIPETEKSVEPAKP